MTFSPATTGIIIVDHGSRRAVSNDKLHEVVGRYRQISRYRIVEPAHMELAEPTIAQAFARCVAAGAGLVVVHPFFLLPGRHWNEDIPALAARAATQNPGVKYLVTAPLGLHSMLMDVIDSRISECLAHAAGETEACELCAGTEKCQFKPQSDNG